MLRIWQESDLCATVNDMILHGFLIVPFLIAFRPASTLSPFCPMHCPMMTYAASANFQLANASFLLNVGGLGLCLSFEEPGPHLQGTEVLGTVHTHRMQH